MFRVEPTCYAFGWCSCSTSPERQVPAVAAPAAQPASGTKRISVSSWELAKVSMPEQDLDHPHVRAEFDEMRRKTVTEEMRCNSLLQPRLFCDLVEGAAD